MAARSMVGLLQSSKLLHLWRPGMAALQQGPRLGQLPSISSATCICTSVLLNSPSQSFFPLPASHMTSAAFQPHLSVACSQPAFSQIPAQGQPLRFHRSIGVTALGRASVTCLSAKGESSSHALPENPRAALLIIGNEILTGKIQDTNTATLAKLLFSRGVDLVRVEVVPDVEDDIVESIRGLWKRVGGQDRGFIFTSGGIGPTHDDVTYAAVAKACGTDLSLHQPTVEKMRTHYEAQGKVLNEARLRMATLPTGSEVLYTPGMWVPLAVVKNVYVLPGIPRLFTAMIDAAKDRFTGALYSRRILYTKQGEGDLAEALSQVAKDFPGVAIGSYPATEPSAPYTTKLSFESRDEDLVAEAVAAAEAHITFLSDDMIKSSGPESP